MFDKFEQRRKSNQNSAYAWWWWANNHYERYKRFVERIKPQLTCQECGGSGGEIDAVLDYGQGPWVDCGWCEGTGLVTPWIRGQWLRWKRAAKGM